MKLIHAFAAASVLVGAVAGTAMAAGNLTTGGTVIKIDMTADKKFSTNAIEIETGKAYNLDITKVGGGEYQFRAPDFFNNIYVYQIVVDGKEIKAHTVDFLEFDEAGTIRLNFVAIRTGAFKYTVPGNEATMTGTITAK